MPASSLVVAEPIATARLTLHPLRVEDADELHPVLADPALHEFIGGHPATLPELRTRWRTLVGGSPTPGVSWCNWTVRWQADGRPVGTLQATITARPSGLEAEIAYVVAAAAQHRGIAREMAAGLVGWLTDRDIGRIVAHVHPAHTASAAVAAHAGLRPTTVVVGGETEWELVLRPGGDPSPSPGR
jgi:RimJ/RimL family protein N-acetyltransferase